MKKNSKKNNFNGKEKNSELVTGPEKRKRGRPTNKAVEMGLLRDLISEIDFEGLTLEQKLKLRDAVLEKSIRKARDDFLVFIHLMAPMVLPEEFVPGRHIEVIARELERVERSVRSEKPERLQIFLPPGGMKTVISSRLFPAWLLGRHPNWRIIGVGHSREFAIDNFGRPVRDLISSEEYQEIFPGTKIKEDVQSSGRWHTTQGGEYYAAGAGTKIAGRRGHIVICDDVVSEQDADSELVRNKINKWYGKGLQTRLLPGGAEVIVNTRWHLEDLSGYLLNSEKNSRRPWRVVKIPALLDEAASALLRRVGDPPNLYAVGSSFWPEFWPTRELLEKKASPTISPADWNALYMQNPVPDEGNIFKEKDLKDWSENDPPSCDFIVISLDTAYGVTKHADYTAYTVWGIFQNLEVLSDGKEEWASNLILLDAGRGRWQFADLCSKCLALMDMYDVDAFLVENKSSGQSLIPELRKRGLPVIDYKPDRDKVTRAHVGAAIVRGGRVWIPKTYEWAREFLAEITAFPFSANDDYTDTFTQMIIWMRDNWKIAHPDDPTYEDDEYLRMLNSHKPKTYWGMIAQS